MNHLFKKLSVLLTVTSFLLVACGDKSVDPPPPPPPPPAPSFSIASVPINEEEVSLILFFATPSKDVKLTRVEVTNPVGTKNELTGGDQIFFKDDPIDLDNPYLRISGSWKFRFVGAVTPTNEAFDVTENVAVSAKVSATQNSVPTECKMLHRP